MAFMIPVYTTNPFWRIETTHGTELVPVSVAPTGELSDFLEGTPLDDATPERIEGWFARLSAPGYMDATDWAGPFATCKEARAHIVDTYDVDPETGDELPEPLALAVSDLNDAGEPGSYQRLIYTIARASTVDEWRAVNNLASDLLDVATSDASSDTSTSLTLNAIATLTHKIRTLQTAILCAAEEV